jgi:hypothetical protein
MQECETSTQTSYVKRVTVRSGGAGHAHSGVVKGTVSRNGTTTDAPTELSKATNGKIVRLGR